MSRLGCGCRFMVICWRVGDDPERHQAAVDTLEEVGRVTRSVTPRGPSPIMALYLEVDVELEGWAKKWVDRAERSIVGRLQEAGFSAEVKGYAFR